MFLVSSVCTTSASYSVLFLCLSLLGEVKEMWLPGGKAGLDLTMVVLLLDIIVTSPKISRSAKFGGRAVICIGLCG